MTKVFATVAALVLAAQASAQGSEGYHLPSAQRVASDGGELVRAFYVDGYGSQAGSVAFMRMPGEEPRLEVHTAAGAVLKAIVPLATWEQVRNDAALTDRKLVPEPRQDVASICLHPWSMSVESVDRARPGRTAVVPPDNPAAMRDWHCRWPSSLRA